eukprot:1365354-Pyramimonas_sp.AAC.1
MVAQKLLMCSAVPNGVPKILMPLSSSGLSHLHARATVPTRSSGHGVGVLPQIASLPTFVSMWHTSRS